MMYLRVTEKLQLTRPVAHTPALNVCRSTLGGPGNRVPDGALGTDTLYITIFKTFNLTWPHRAAVPTNTNRLIKITHITPWEFCFVG